MTTDKAAAYLAKFREAYGLFEELDKLWQDMTRDEARGLQSPPHVLDEFMVPGTHDYPHESDHAEPGDGPADEPDDHEHEHDGET